MPLYIRTRDNVVLRFENIQDVNQWVSDGKVTMQAVFLTDDKVWKPIAELLKKAPDRIEKKIESPPAPRSVGMESEMDGEPAWVPKAKVILPVSDWDNDLDDDDDDFDFEEGGSKKGIFIVSLLIVLAGVGIAGYILFGNKLFPQKNPKTAEPGHPVIAKEAEPVPQPEKRLVQPEPTKPAPVAGVVAKPDASVHAIQQAGKDANIHQQVAANQTKPPAKIENKPIEHKKTASPVPKTEKRRLITKARSPAKRPRRRLPSIREQKTSDQHMTLGNRLLIQGKVKRAEAHFQYVLSIRPRSVEALTQVGKCEMRLGHLKKAIRYFNNALSINREYSPAMIGLARLYKKQGNRSKAAAYYSKYVELHPYGLNVDEAKAFLGVK